MASASTRITIRSFTTGVAEFMKRRFSGILLLSFLLIGALLQLNVSGQNGAGCDTNTCTVNVNRQISTNNWGTTIINDTITITSSNASITQMLLGFPIQIGPNVRNVTATDLQTGQALPVASKTPSEPNYTALQLSLPNKKPPPTYSLISRPILTY